MPQTEPRPVKLRCLGPSCPGHAGRKQYPAVSYHRPPRMGAALKVTEKKQENCGQADNWGGVGRKYLRAPSRFVIGLTGPTEP